MKILSCKLDKTVTDLSDTNEKLRKANEDIRKAK